MSLSGQGDDARKVLIQTAHRDNRGQLVYFEAKGSRASGKGRVRPGWQAAKGDEGRSAKSLGLLGPLLDPDNDCKLTKDEDKMTIKIDVPGKLHTLSPEVTTRKNRKVSLNNAPITMTEVDGDFAAFVQVTGEIRVRDPQGSAGPRTSLHGAERGPDSLSRQGELPQTRASRQHLH